MGRKIIIHCESTKIVSPPSPQFMVKFSVPIIALRTSDERSEVNKLYLFVLHYLSADTTLVCLV